MKSKIEVIQSRSSEVDTQKCAELIGNRYDMILIAATRSRELSAAKINKPNISALLEIQNGTIGRDYLNRVK